MSKIFLHLGAHKTATTFLQANFTASKAAFTKQGWKFICFQRQAPSLRKHVLKARKGKNVNPHGKEELDRFFAKVRNDPHDIFFSSEILLGQMSVRRTGVIYPHHMEMLKNLKEHFAGKDVRVGFCIRDFGDYVESGYNWLIGKGKSQNFQIYQKKITVRKLSWLKIIEHMSEIFGADNLVLWTYEDFKKDSVGALKEIAKAAGLDPKGITVPKQEPRNVSKPPEVIELLNSWNKVLRARDDLSSEQKQDIRGKVRALLTEIPPNTKPQRHLSARKRERFTALYEKELEEIKARWGKSMLTFS